MSKELIKEQTIFVTSDTHFGHLNICRGTSNWNSQNSSNPNNTRDFDNIKEMNDAVVNAINSRVGEDDILYHLGDWSFGGWKNIYEFRKRINCKNIHLILGNHDEHIWKDKFFPHLSKDENGNISEIEDPNKYRVMSTIKHKFDVTARDFFSSVARLDVLKYKKSEIVLCHFPMEEWELMDSGSFHLHGHCHGSLAVSEFRKEDVGLDAQNFSVMSLAEVLTRLASRNIKGHHIN